MDKPQPKRKKKNRAQDAYPIHIITKRDDIRQARSLWQKLDSSNILGWKGFIEYVEPQVCLAWLVYECVFWGRAALHTLNLILDKEEVPKHLRFLQRTARTGFQHYKKIIKDFMKEVGEGAMDFIFLNLPVRSPLNPVRCVNFMKFLVDQLETLETYEAFLREKENDAANIYNFFYPGEKITERIPLDFMHLVPQLGAFYAYFANLTEKMGLKARANMRRIEQTILV